jgi:uncharacterized protein YjbI with pentapeptide repeats
MEVLAAYIRENSPWPPTSSRPSEESYEAFKRDRLNPETSRLTNPTILPTDIRAILEVISRREEDRVPKELRVRFDLRSTDLRGADLTGIQLKGAVLADAHLEGASLLEANLDGAMLEGAHLEGAELDNARLERAHLAKAHLEEANLGYAHLEGTNLTRAHLERANLMSASLKGAYLTNAYLQDAMLEGANLMGADLSQAVGLTAHQIWGTIGKEETTLPEYLVDQRPEQWSKSIEEQEEFIYQNVIFRVSEEE